MFYNVNTISCCCCIKYFIYLARCQDSISTARPVTLPQQLESVLHPSSLISATDTVYSGSAADILSQRLGDVCQIMWSYVKLVGFLLQQQTWFLSSKLLPTFKQMWIIIEHVSWKYLTKHHIYDELIKHYITNIKICLGTMFNCCNSNSFSFFDKVSLVPCGEEEMILSSDFSQSQPSINML